MLETILSGFLVEAPWVAILVIILYFIYHNLKRTDEELKQGYELILKELARNVKELKEADEKNIKELKEADERIVKELREADEKMFKELKEADEKMFKELKEADEKMFKELKEADEKIIKEMRKGFKNFAIAALSIQEATLSLLSQKEIITNKEASSLKITTNNFIKLASETLTNPFTKYEKERLLYLTSKEPQDVTHDEALELYNLSFRVIDEFPDKIEAYLVFQYAVILKYSTFPKEDKK